MLPTLLALTLWTQERVDAPFINKDLVGKSIMVEDVYSGSGGKGEQRSFRLRLAPSNVKFVADTGVDSEGLRGNLEVTGLVRLEGRDIIVAVSRIVRLPEDPRRFADRMRELGDGNAKPWYDLAFWARKRGNDYDQPEMLKKGLEAYHRALAIHRRSAANNSDELNRIKHVLDRDQWVKDYDLQGLDFEIYRAEYRTVKTQGVDQITAFRDQLRPKLGMGNLHLQLITPLSPEKRELYDKDPVAFFEKGSRNDRASAVRYWECQITDELLQQEKRSLLDQAKQAKEILPDYPEFAQRRFRQWVEDTNHDLTSLKADQLADFHRVVSEEVGRPDQAKEYVRRWLDFHHDRIQNQPPKSRNVNEIYDLARAFGKYAGIEASRDVIFRLLTGALTLDPAYGPAAGMLREMGYRKNDAGGWTRSDAKQSYSARLGDSGLKAGMAAQEILQTRGAPDAQSRMITKLGNETDVFRVTHQWVYGAGAGSKIYVYLEPTANGQLYVTAWKTVRE